MTQRDIIATKAEVLCWGLQTNDVAEGIYKTQHPTAHKRTGNAGLHLLVNGVVLNAIYGEPFSEKSPYHLEKEGANLLLYKGKKPISTCTIIAPPKWYNKRTQSGVLMSDVFLQEGKDTLITAIWNNCAYFSKNLQCQYCVLGYEKGVEFKQVDEVVETVQTAVKEKQSYYVHLTGGNTFAPDHGISYYEKYVKAIRKKNTTVPISLEISPPDDVNWIDKLVASGASGFSINIEIWDEAKRKIVCPGKSQIKRDRYYEAWQRGVQLLGKFKISSMLIVGLDRPESIKKGITALIQLGVKPTLIPFRPFSRSLLSSLSPPHPDILMELSVYAGDQLHKHGAFYNSFVGCEHCGACTLENDYLNNL